MDFIAVLTPASLLFVYDVHFQIFASHKKWFTEPRERKKEKTMVQELKLVSSSYFSRSFHLQLSACSSAIFKKCIFSPSI